MIWEREGVPQVSSRLATVVDFSTAAVGTNL